MEDYRSSTDQKSEERHQLQSTADRCLAQFWYRPIDIFNFFCIFLVLVQNNSMLNLGYLGTLENVSEKQFVRPTQAL